MSDLNINLPAMPEEAKAYIGRIFGPLAETGDLIADKIRFYRWKSSLRTMNEARVIATENGYEVNEVPLKTLVPLLEGASLEDDDSPLITKWANLLALAAHNSAAVPVAYVSVLEKLDPNSAALLDRIIDDATLDELCPIPEDGAPEPNIAKLSAHATSLFFIVNEVISGFPDQFEEFDQRRTDFWAEIEEANGMESVVAKVEQVIVHFGEVLQDTKGIYFRSDDLLNAETVDSLVSTGLLERREVIANIGEKRAFIRLVCPTGLSLGFLRACKGC